MKFISEKTKDEFETFFITILESKTNRQTSYLKLPTNNCFSYCVKEIIHTLKNEKMNSRISGHSHQLINNFYQFMLNDIILKEIDLLAYSRILLTLKSYSENKSINVSEKLSFFENIDAHYSKKYHKKVYETIKVMAENNIVDEQSYKVIILLIDEILSFGTNYLYLNYILELYKQKKFINFLSFLDYIFNANLDCFDVLIPIAELEDKEIALFQLKGQKIELHNGITYCKVYSNNVSDFFFLIKENILRIESLFNILRLYKNSKIDFLRNEYILVTSKYFHETFQLTFEDITQYVGPNPDYKNLKKAVLNLDKLKEREKNSYHSVLNTISYAEKDKDYVNASSFVDNWIALESLTSLSGRQEGYACVEFIVPKMLVARIIFNDATNTLENIHLKHFGPRMNLEKFIELVCNNTLDFSKITNPFYKLEITRLAKNFSSTQNLQKEFDRVESMLSLDLLRIYILRNEYVHASNLSAFNSMQYIKIKHILPLCIDEFFKQLNNRIGRDVISNSIVYDVFSEVLSKRDICDVSFRLLNDKVRIANGRVILDTDIDSLGITLDTYIFNVLKNNTELFRKYVIYED